MPFRPSVVRALLLVGGLAGGLLAPACQGEVAERRTHAPTPTDSAWAALVLELSEPGGYFDTDNLISNERSYLHVVGALEELEVEGGAYIGVGPDQSFSYMAAVRPEVAYLVDIRRDNLLQHLMFRALFELSGDRAEYLALWTGRQLPARPEGWAAAGIGEIVAAVDSAPLLAREGREAVTAVRERVAGFGLPLSEEDLATVERFHRAFVRDGLDLRFRSHGRRPRYFYPTLRDLLLEEDLSGRRRSYLADRDDFLFLKRMQEERRVIPVVGDLAGPHALGAIGNDIRHRGLEVSAFYTSNVEFYLMRAGTFGRFARTVTGLPRNERSVLVRSCFNRCTAVHPQSVSGYHSTQLLQRLVDFVDVVEGNGFAGYQDLVTRQSVELR